MERSGRVTFAFEWMHRTMAVNRQPPEHQKEEMPPQTPPGEDRSTSALREELEQDDIFCMLAKYASASTQPSRADRPAVQSPAADSPAQVPPPVASSPSPAICSASPVVSSPSPVVCSLPPVVHSSRLFPMQMALLAGTVIVGALFVYAFLGRMRQTPRVSRADAPGSWQNTYVPPQPQAAGPAPQRSSLGIVEPSLPGPEPLSLQLAEKLYLGRDFEHALVMYDKLYRRLPATEENQPLRDLLLLRMALCHKNDGDVAQADSLFRTVSLSRLPILRTLARYHQSAILMNRKRFLEAAAKVWQTTALIEVIDHDRKWVSAVQRQCRFLAAETMTRNLLSLCDADNDVPAELWTRHPDIDPFTGMEEPQLRALLTSGAEKLDTALLSPQIRPAGDRSAIRRWSVLCNGASLEELLARFASHARLDVRWTDNGQAVPAEDNMRRRPVYLYLASASAQEVVTTAAGSVGLLARIDDKGNVNVLDPASYSSLAEHTNVLADESASLWRRFLMAAEDDERAANSHFALGLLQTVRGQFDEAIAEYKLVANRFAKHNLAPHALLHSGKLKVRLRDYVGAHEDFKQLVEVYPESDLSDPACLYLAEATMKAGLYEEATGLYRKVYNLGLSAEAQAESALGAGRCFHETKNYKQAAHWLNRYVMLARDQNRPEFHAACLLLGKTYLALHNPQQAQVALNLALKGELSRQQHVETIAVLTRTYIEQGLFLEALQILEAAGRLQLSQQETIELLLLRVQVLRSIGLTDKATALLAEKGQFLPSPELKGKVAIELARCYVEAGALEPARKTLSEAFGLVEPGSLAQQIGCELVRTCLRLGAAGQAISVCSRMLEHAGPVEREPIVDLLAEGYRAQAKYDRAVAVLLDRYDGTADPNRARN